MPQDPPLTRLLRLQNGHNFRDLGGYATQDGRRVRWRRVFRSGVMAQIDGEDARLLRGLGVVTICDLRTNRERSHRPTEWHGPETTELLSRDYEMSAGALHQLAARQDATAADMHAMMCQIYRDLPYEQADSYRVLFSRLAAGALPLVFNCSAGKDRTGIAAALLLAILGVPRETIVEDYMLTNEGLQRLVQILSHEPGYGHLVRDRIDVAMPLLRAEPAYLDTMFAELTTRHGSIDGYLHTVLAVDQAAIRRHLLEEEI